MLSVTFLGLCGICGRIEIIRFTKIKIVTLGDRVYNKNWKSFMGWGSSYRVKRTRWVFFPTYLCQPLVGTRLCCIDGSWGEKDLFTGQGWFCTTSSYDYMLGAMTIGRCLSHLYT